MQDRYGRQFTANELRQDIDAAIQKGLSGKYAFTPETAEAILNKADTLRRQRDEALRALRALTSHKDSKLSTDVEYIGIYQRAQRILAQCESEDAECRAGCRGHAHQGNRDQHRQDTQDR